jgi:hypothetical protein
MGIFRRQNPVQNRRWDYVAENPDANPVAIKQLSTSFTDRKGKNAWDYLNEHRIAAFEIIKRLASDSADPSSCFSGLASGDEICSVALAMNFRFRDERGDSVSQYLLTHMSIALELFKPTQLYEDFMLVRSDFIRLRALHRGGIA